MVMLNLDRSFAGYSWEAAGDDLEFVFRPVDDLWLKVANAMPENSTEKHLGTLAFCGDVLECLLDELDE